MPKRHRRQELPPEGLWISPEGEKLTVVEHLPTIRQHPELFGLSETDVMGASIRNLREIAEELIRNGWIRYRYLSGTYHFEVKSARERIRIIEDILVAARAHDAEEVRISQVVPKREFIGVVGDVFERRIFGYQENPIQNKWRLT